MSTIAVQKSSEHRGLQNLFDKIRNKAYCLFERRGRAHGFDLEDWLAAEEELLWTPAAEVKETDSGYELRIPVTGFESKELNLTATETSVTLTAESSRPTQERSLFSRIDLPSSTDADKVTASLEKGVLIVTAPKVKPAPAEPPKQLAAAA